MIFQDRKTSCSKYHFGNQFMVNYDLSNNYFMPSFSAWNAQGSKYSQKYIQYVSKYVIWSERAALACLDADWGIGDGAGGKHNFSAGGAAVLQYHPDKKDYISLVVGFKSSEFCHHCSIPPRDLWSTFYSHKCKKKLKLRERICKKKLKLRVFFLGKSLCKHPSTKPTIALFNFYM